MHANQMDCFKLGVRARRVMYGRVEIFSALQKLICTRISTEN